jgi:hypothetical protein
VGYTRLQELDIDPEGQRWMDFPKAAKVDAVAADPEDECVQLGALDTLGAMLEQAKASLAGALGVEPHQVEIAIRA